MKNKLFIILLFLLTVQHAQAQNFNSTLLKSYSKQELKSYSIDELKVLEYGISNAIYFADIPEGKETDFKEVIDLNGSLNFTDYQFKISSENQYYKVKNSNKILVVKSMYVLKNELLNSVK